MQKKSFGFVLIMIYVILLLSACGGGANSGGEAPSGDQGDSRPTPPVKYTNLKSPELSSSDLEKGGQTYQIYCASCHGKEGMGDGPASSSLDPKPEPLAKNVASLSDDYLVWRISEGGQIDPFKSAMPAWGTILDEQQIWQIIGYIRNFGG